MTANPALIADIVAANHILYDHGVVDAFGHVSARHDKQPDRFLLARNMAERVHNAVVIEDMIGRDDIGDQSGIGGHRGRLN